MKTSFSFNCSPKRLLMGFNEMINLDMHFSRRNFIDRNVLSNSPLHSLDLPQNFSHHYMDSVDQSSEPDYPQDYEVLEFSISFKKKSRIPIDSLYEHTTILPLKLVYIECMMIDCLIKSRRINEHFIAANTATHNYGTRNATTVRLPTTRLRRTEKPHMHLVLIQALREDLVATEAPRHYKEEEKKPSEDLLSTMRRN